MSETGKGPMNDLDRQSRAQIGKQAHRDVQAATDVEKWAFLT